MCNTGDSKALYTGSTLSDNTDIDGSVEIPLQSNDNVGNLVIATECTL